MKIGVTKVAAGVEINTMRGLPCWSHTTLLTPKEAKALASEIRKAAGGTRKPRKPKADAQPV